MNKKQIIPTIFIIMGIVIAFVPAFQLFAYRFGLKQIEAADFEQGKIAFLGENSLIPVSDPAAPEPKVVKKMPVVITAYSSTVWETDDTPLITAANTAVRDGVIANNYLPFGTKVRMPEIYGEKIFVVEDRMSWTKGNYHVDIWFPSHQEAKEFGAKKSYIEVLEI